MRNVDIVYFIEWSRHDWDRGKGLLSLGREQQSSYIGTYYICIHKSQGRCEGESYYFLITIQNVVLCYVVQRSAYVHDVRDFRIA